jgi:acetate kinase
MKILTLRFTSKSLNWSLFIHDRGGMQLAASDLVADMVFETGKVHDLLAAVGARSDGLDPEIIAFRAPYGGSEFPGPVLADGKVLERLEELIPQSPIHVPRTLMMVRICQEVFPGVPVALLFETSFFTKLPCRESLYAIETQRQGKPAARRFGYHGLHHEAACAAAQQRWALQGEKTRPAVLSVYLGNHSEIAGAMGNTALTVTSGASPLEGLVGSTMCGDIDPAAILEIAERKKWGPEQIDTVISRKSGLLGLTGERVTLDEIFAQDKELFVKARAIVQYRMLCAAGAAAAALGTINLIVFSGPFAHLGSILGPYFASCLFAKGPRPHKPVDFFILPQSLDEIIAARALMVFLSARNARLARNSKPVPALRRA